ncbi:MAG: hypothetical protein GEU93_18885 [Propionibacteriales bacterium]|nr:hypothetical protein [Propionibacteriales bacterium]
MKSYGLGGALAIVLAASAVLAAPASGDDSLGTGRVAVCLVQSGEADSERTVHVSERAADELVRTTRSYRGPCASYGESAPLGDGSLTAYSQTEDGTPTSIGVVFPSSTLDGLPHDPPTAGLWCYDKNDDGTVDPITECAGGYENALHLSDDFRESVDSPFTYVLANWNPHGHVPPGIYDLPHFDIHFYTTPNSQRLAIRPGPCPALVNCDDYRLGKILPESRYIAPDYVDADAIEPAMGNHLVDPTSPEFHGAQFTHTFIYGTWNGEITFYEPMVTHELFSDLVAGARDDACFRVKLPQAWQSAGWYPTEYCLRYRENRDELTASLEGFVYRHAS